MQDDATRPVSLGELRAGLQLRAGAAITLLVGGAAKAAGQESAATKGAACDSQAAGAEGRGQTSAGTGSSEARGSRASGASSATSSGAPQTGASTATQAPEGALANPRWSQSRLVHGQTARLQVDARGLDGRTVRFKVEQRRGDAWETVSEPEATVQGGVASASLEVAHPTGGARLGIGARPSPLRFSARLA